MAFEKPPTAGQVAKLSDIPMPSDLCKCGEQGILRLVMVTDTSTGESRVGSFSRFGFYKHSKDGMTDWNSLEMNGRWQFDRWINLCADCNARASAGLPPPKKSDQPEKYTDKQVRYAWMWLMGEVACSGDSAQLSGTFKRIRLTDEQKNTAIEIVNYEALRHDQPESVPEMYRLDNMIDEVRI